MKEIFLTYILTFAAFVGFGQDIKQDSIHSVKNNTNINNTRIQKKDWRTVTIGVLECNLGGDDCPSYYHLGAEGCFIFKNQPKTINELRPRQIKKLKKYAAQWGCSMVYVDLNHLWIKNSCCGTVNCYGIAAVPQKKK